MKAFERTSNSSDFETITEDDAAWILTNSFLILTMQSGFALLEAGCVSHKNVANIVMKNTVDIVVGGLSYWMFGYGLSFGRTSTPLFGTSDFFVSENISKNGSGTLYSRYMFQFGFAATSTTIVSGAIAERIKFNSYLLFSFLNTLIYSFPANWIWNKQGFLKSIGFLDFAGGCAVHFSGGVVSLIGTQYLGPRMNRFTESDKYSMSSPVTALTGTLMLWWAWLGFNCGSTFGIHGQKWKLASLVAVNTMNSSIGGGIAGLLLSYLLRNKTYDIGWFINSVLGSLVSITGICAYISPFQSLLIGMVGGGIAVLGGSLVDKLKIDDPVGVIPVHLFSSIWGMLMMGLLANCNDSQEQNSPIGLACSGSPYLLAVQILGMACTLVWCSVTSLALFWAIDKLFGLRISEGDEFLGADWTEHGILQQGVGIKLSSAAGTFHRNNLEEETVLKMIRKDMKNFVERNHTIGIGPIFEPGGRESVVTENKGIGALVKATAMMNNMVAKVGDVEKNISIPNTASTSVDCELQSVVVHRNKEILSVTSLQHPHVPETDQ